MDHLNPLRVFSDWYREAIDAGIADPSIMTLATASPDGHPSARTVLLKSYNEHGFIFFTNYMSRKSMDLENNPRAALVLHWMETGRQVRIEGNTERISAKESDEYFCSRPRGSQLGAWASEQSRAIPSKAYMDESLQKREAEFQDRDVPRPPNWGGYLVIPDSIEFWTDRENRMHERLLFEKTGDGWTTTRLAP